MAPVTDATLPEWLENAPPTSARRPDGGVGLRERPVPEQQTSHYMLDPAIANNPMHEPLDMLPSDRERKISQHSRGGGGGADAPEAHEHKESAPAVRVCPVWLRTGLAKASAHPLCPSWIHVCRVMSFAVIGLVLWCVMYSLGGNTATPGGQLFNLYVLYVTSVLAGYVAHGMCLPPLVGMLLMGVLLRNVGFLSVSGSYLSLVTFLRRTALMAILTRAAIELDLKHLERFSCVLLRLTLLPSTLEAVVISILARYVLGLSWMWGVFLGMSLSSAAPAVILPSLFNLQLKNYGTDKDIPALIIAASSFDDAVSLLTFGIPLSVIVGEGDVWRSIFGGPIRIIIGLTLGVTWGVLLKFVPEMYDDYVHILRALLLGLGGTAMLLMSGEYGFEGAGSIACMVGAIIASHHWRTRGLAEHNKPVANCFAVVWALLRPVLFSLIGGEVDLSSIDARMIGLAAAVIYGGLLVRMLAAVWVSSGTKLNRKEKTFIACCWLPKGTVQAATAPTALDLTRLLGMDTTIVTASTNFLYVVILAILLTAPLGALLPFVGRRLLTKATHVRSQSDTESIVTVGAFSELASGVVNRGFIVDPWVDWSHNRASSF